MKNFRWTICALVFFATTINYLDRQVIAILKPILEGEIGLNEIDYGYVVMAFQVAYAVGMIFAGRLIDAVGTRMGYALALIFWSVAAMLHAFARSAFSFGVFRALLGFSEAGNFPAAIKTVAEWFPKKERALATGIFNSGANVGALLAPVVVPWLAYHLGWQSAFLLVGAIGFIWLIFWFMWYQVPEKSTKVTSEELAYIKSDRDEQQESDDQVSWWRLLHYPQTWAFVIGKFLTDPIWWFYLFWIPGWLATVRGTGLDLKSFGLPMVVIYTATTIGSIGGGWLSSFLISKGMPVYKSRKITMLLFALLVVPIVFTQSEGVSLWMAILLISLAAASHQAWSANIFTTVSDMFPKKVVSSVTGLGGMAGAVGGTLIAFFAGHILEFYKKMGHIETGYSILFIIAGTAYLLAWLVYHLLVPKMKRVAI
ncbi:MAG TPA: MFS transporter [Bacteroidales bacterium]|nr:MFS transporter [Bacteroidales bacterium]HPO64467.1 MFS transporter [Bacteroidales bacterium]